MLSVTTIVSFVSAISLLAFSPGTDNIFVFTQSAMRGWRVGFAVTLGLCTGLIVHTSAVAFGVSAILQRSAMAFFVLKIVGAAYLLYMAYRAFRAGPVSLQGQSATTLPYHRMYVRGFFMNIANPKVALFSLAFLPQFVDPKAGPATMQIFALGGVFILTSFCAFTLIAVLAGVMSERFVRSERASVIMNRVAGTVFVGLALRLALAKR